MNKYSSAEVGQMMKLASGTVRALSEENQELKTKVAGFEKKELAEKIADQMETKGLEPETPRAEKVANLLKREDLSVVQEAVGMSAPQVKFASVAEDGVVTVEGGLNDDDGGAETRFASQLASISG